MTIRQIKKYNEDKYTCAAHKPSQFITALHIYLTANGSRWRAVRVNAINLDWILLCIRRYQTRHRLMSQRQTILQALHLGAICLQGPEIVTLPMTLCHK